MSVFDKKETAIELNEEYKAAQGRVDKLYQEFRVLVKERDALKLKAFESVEPDPKQALLKKISRIGYDDVKDMEHDSFYLDALLAKYLFGYTSLKREVGEWWYEGCDIFNAVPSNVPRYTQGQEFLEVLEAMRQRGLSYHVGMQSSNNSWVWFSDDVRSPRYTGSGDGVYLQTVTAALKAVLSEKDVKVEKLKYGWDSEGWDN